MSSRIVPVLFCLAALAACGDGQPLFDEVVPDITNPGDGTDTDGDGELDAGVELPPGTDEPESDEGIIRFEARDGTGGGLVTDVSYDATNDTFSVDNLGFDGANVYQRGTAVATLGGYAVYDADVVTEDFLTGEQIDRSVAQEHDRMIQEVLASGPGVEKYDLLVCYDLAKPDEKSHY